MEKCTLFTEDDCNVLYRALHEAAGCKAYDDIDSLYDYMEETPRSSFVVNIIEALRASGYEIKKVEK